MDIKEVFNRQNEQDSNPSVRERINRIKSFLNAVLQSKEELAAAIYGDFGKSRDEVFLSELIPFTLEARYAIRNLKKWMKPAKAESSLTLFGAKGKIYFRPKGNVLIISPWNYPFALAAGPIVSALAAGNRIILKPSEKTPNTSKYLKDLIERTFPIEIAAVFEGDAEVAKELLKLPFDHIFFTGSTTIGREVMKAAAVNLTPVTLELGGKSPAIIDEENDLKIAAEKITWGKLLNAGQTCIAPDYVLIRKKYLKEFIKLVKENLSSMFLLNPAGVSDVEFCEIVNKESFERLNLMLKDAIENGAHVALSTKFSGNNRRFPPCLLTDVKPDSKLMREEIFGPILPVLTYESIDEALDIIRRNPNPLSFYIFSGNKKFIGAFTEKINSGGVVINDVVINFIHTGLPFGGIKTSGLGKAHGYYGFKEFSNETPVLKQFRLAPIKLLYPPYNDFKRKLIEFIFNYF